MLRSHSFEFSSTNKTDHHDITEILLKAALNTINLHIDLLSFRNIVDIVYCLLLELLLVSVLNVKIKRNKNNETDLNDKEKTHKK